MEKRKRKLSAHHDSPSAAPKHISLEDLRFLRLRAQGLGASRATRPALVDVVRTLCGVNAQLPSAMALSLRARIEGLTLEDIEISRVQERTVVRTWCMRGTMHLLAADDLDWLLAAIPPSEIGGGWRWLTRRGGLAKERAAQVLEAAYQTLKSRGPMIRRDLMAMVAEKYGPEVEAAAAGVVHLNGLLGRICFGPYRGVDPT
ncbi:MAG: hypothetical protein EXR62_11760 [Chloroflexi bacterium]|nr:hypothetical protein [Chloroflexota bacterium]